VGGVGVFGGVIFLNILFPFFLFFNFPLFSLFAFWGGIIKLEKKG